MITRTFDPRDARPAPRSLAAPLKSAPKAVSVTPAQVSKSTTITMARHETGALITLSVSTRFADRLEAACASDLAKGGAGPNSFLAGLLSSALDRLQRPKKQTSNDGARLNSDRLRRYADRLQTKLAAAEAGDIAPLITFVRALMLEAQGQLDFLTAQKKEPDVAAGGETPR